MALPKYTGKELTKHLRLLAMEAESVSDEGETITKAEALARLLWKKALGFAEMVMKEGSPKEVKNPPEAWAIQLIYERLEGKVANTAPEEAGKITAAEKVSELARSRINNVLVGAAIPAVKPLPPKLPRKEKHGDS